MSERPIDHDLERRVRDLELAMSGTAPARLPRRRSPARRVSVVIATVIALVALPMITVASDVFRDVGSSHAFHGDINELYNARITRGCATNPLRYCPDDALTRGQMAGMLTRGLGRVVQSGGNTNGGGVVASITIDAGGLPGGTGYVLISATVTANALDPDSCPCGIGAAVELAPVEYPELTYDINFNLSGPQAPTIEGTHIVAESGSWSEVVPVPTGESTTFDLFVGVGATAPGIVHTSGRLTALYVPFDGAP